MKLVAACAFAFVSTAAIAAPKFEVKNNELVVPGPVLFETGSAKLKPESDATLAHVAAYLDDKTYISTLRVEVHTDNTGNATANLKLSVDRSLAVAKALVKRGVDCKRLVAVGFGGDKPIAANDTAENKAKNRRTVFANAALRGRAIGGMPLDGGGQDAGDVCK